VVERAKTTATQGLTGLDFLLDLTTGLPTGFIIRSYCSFFFLRFSFILLFPAGVGILQPGQIKALAGVSA
jgi:hypothetical protein